MQIRLYSSAGAEDRLVIDEEFAAQNEEEDDARDDVGGKVVEVKPLVVSCEFLAIREVSCRRRILQDFTVDVLQGI